MAIIYETVNLYNKTHGIMPWRYIGSDQYNRPEYFGSSKALKEDVARLGSEFFVKHVLEDAGDIDNKTLRYKEAYEYLQPNKVKTDPTYYNKSDRYGPGGAMKKGTKQKKPRSQEHIEKIIEHRTGSTKSESARQLMRDKKLGTTAKPETKKKMSEKSSGEKNSNSLTWTIVTPSGETLNIKGLRKWASDNGHNYYHIYGSTNGWTSTKHGTGRGGPGKKKEQQSANR
jgi:hypothetical protein